MPYPDGDSLIRVDKQAYLHEVDIFRDLDSDEVAALGKHAPMQRVEAGTIFYSPDQPTEVLFILKEGRVRLYQLSTGGKLLTTTILDAGTIFGEMALLGQGLYGSYAEALTPCLLCLMSREDVKTLLLSDPQIAFRITEILGRRLLETERRLSDMAFKKVPERLVSLLLQLADRPRTRLFGGNRPEVRYTHEALGEMIGTYRETVTKVLNELQERGWIQLAGPAPHCPVDQRRAHSTVDHAAGPERGQQPAGAGLPRTGASPSYQLSLTLHLRPRCPSLNPERDQ